MMNNILFTSYKHPIALGSGISRDFFYYSLLITCHIMLVWLLPYFPTQDGPSHLYNLVIFNDLIKGGKDWGNHFGYQINFLPNWGFNVIAYPLLQFFPPVITERIFISIYILLMGSSTLFFLRSFNQPSFPNAYFIFLVIFNYTLMMGNYSYTIGIPLFFIALSLQWKYVNRPTSFKLSLLNISGFVLFLFHLIPFCFFLLTSIILSWFGSNDHRGKISAIYRPIVILSPSIIILSLYLWQSRMNFSHTSFFPSVISAETSHLFSISRLITLASELVLFSTDNFSRWQPLAGLMLISLFIGLIYDSVIRIIRKAKSGEKISKDEKALGLIAAGMTLIYFVAPVSLGAGSLFNQRMPWVIYLILIPLVRFPNDGFFNRYARIMMVGGVVVVLFINAVIFSEQSTRIENFLNGLQVTFPKGSFVMTYKAPSAEDWNVDALLHVASYYGMAQKIVDVGNYEAQTPFFPIYFRKELGPLPHFSEIELFPDAIDLELYPVIQFLIGVRIIGQDRVKVRDSFQIIFEKEEVTIWQRSER